MVAIGLWCLILSGCTAACVSYELDQREASQTAEEALAAISVPDSLGASETTSRGCQDFMSPRATRDERSALPPEEVDRVLRWVLSSDGWSYERTPAGDNRYTKGTLVLWANAVPAADGSRVELAMESDTVSCW